MELTKVDSLPPLIRGRGVRKSKEAEEVIASLKTGEIFKIDGIKRGNEYNALQQRIRSLAKQANVKVTIRFAADEEKSFDDVVVGSLYFQGMDIPEDEDMVEVEATVPAKKASKAKK